MEITKIAIVGIAGAVLSIILKEEKNSFSILTSVMTSVIIFIFILPRLSGIVNEITDIAGDIGVYKDYILVMLKSLAVAYIGMFSSQLCRDFGQNSIGDKIELGGKVIILITALPILNSLVDKILRFIQ